MLFRSGESAPAYVAVDRLGARLGKAPGTQMVAATFNGMARTVTRMKGLDFKGLGKGGRLLVPEPKPATGAEAST